MIKLILFDFEDTLVRTQIDFEPIRDKVREFFVHKGLPLDFKFKPILSQIKHASLLLNDPTLSTHALAIISQEELKALAHTTLIEGAENMLRYFRSKDVLLGIFSRTSGSLVEQTIEKYGLGFFALIVSRETVEEPKPSPQGIRYALEKLHVAADETIVVGDHPFDIQAGIAAGTHTVGVRGGMGNENDLVQLGAEIVLDSVAQIPDYYEKQFLPHDSNSRL